MNTIVVGLNFGDEGKGSIVNYLADSHDIVCKFNGGFQAAHNVIHEGKHHTFSLFGSGTFKGLPTYIDSNVIVDPISLYNEWFHLRTLGYTPEIHIHPECLIATPFHREANRILDSINKHGSCGVGIGLTRQMFSETGNGLFWHDFLDCDVERKLKWIKQYCQDKVLDYSKKIDNLDLQHKLKLQTTVFDVTMAYYSYAHTIYENVNIKSSLGNVLKNKKVLFEGAQGIHLDEVYGTIPHTTYSDTTPARAIELCRQLGSSYSIVGVTRTFETRHGNGPMYCETFNDDIIEDDHNYDNDSFAGRFRCGYLNIDWINKICDILNIDKLAINHYDKRDIKYLENQFNKPIYIRGYGPEDKVRNG